MKKGVVSKGNRFLAEGRKGGGKGRTQTQASVGPLEDKAVVIRNRIPKWG